MIITYQVYRSMLFTLNSNKLASDLLYNRVLYISDEVYNFLLNDIAIKDACNLSELLRYYNYKQFLSFNDIKKIHKTLFTKNKLISYYTTKENDSIEKTFKNKESLPPKYYKALEEMSDNLYPRLLNIKKK